MNTRLILFFCLIFVTGFSQNKLSERYNLMPWPQKIEAKNLKLPINEQLTISINVSSSERLQKAGTIFLRRLSGRTGVFINEGFPVKDSSSTIQIHFDTVSSLSIDSDESYSLEVNATNAIIRATTDVGALRGLETLLQLTTQGVSDYYFPGVSIYDAPRFVWRGLMIDAARHFQPVAVIKRNLDAMASLKMNVFHWHLSDDQGFRIESKVFPKLHLEASDGLYYTQNQIKEIVSYASNLGIRVVPEIDVPGHATAILTAYPELGSKKGYVYTIERFSGIFNPTLNPTLESTYVFLDELFTEIASLFPDQYFHIGGDENEGKHWNGNESIQAFKNINNLNTNHELQTYLNIRLEKILNSLGKKLMGWDEIMTPTMPTTALIHAWRGENEGMEKGGAAITAAKQGFQAVLSNGYYIDRMLSVEHHYSVDPIGDVTLTEAERARVLGGEATMWSELVTPLTIDSRIWPRTAAIAERLWSSKDVNAIDNMKRRLKVVSHQLEELGITHLSSSAVILRNLSNNYSIEALQVLVSICEPLKIYSRNAGGTEYKTFSPFTLFADACTADAEAAAAFKIEVALFINAANDSGKQIDSKAIQSYLRKWSENHTKFVTIPSNPKLKPLKVLSENLSEVSKILLTSLVNKKITQSECDALKNCIMILSNPHADVELAILNPLNKLIKHIKFQYLKIN
jgi:hexosaminidase